MKLRNKIFTIVLVSLLVVAVAMIIVGYALIGADIIGWLTSPYAMWVYVFGGIFIAVWAGLEIHDRIKKL